MTRSTFLFLFIYLNIQNHIVQGQSGLRYDGSVMVIDQKGVRIRKSPSLESEVLCAVKFGEMVMPTGKRENDTVQGMSGAWVNIEYKQYTGYIFSAYLSVGNIQDHNINFKKGLPQFFFEPKQCGNHLFFNSELKWYGVYETRWPNWRSIQRVKIEFDVSKDHFEENKNDELQLGPPYLSMQIRDTSETVLLFGTMDSLKHHGFYKIPLPTKHHSGSYMNVNAKSNFIYPGEVIGLGSKVILACSGSTNEDVNDIISGKKFEEYRVQVIFKDGQNRIIQDLKMNPFDRFEFIGDLNGDSICDLIIRDLTSSDSYENSTYLLMSGYEKNKLVKVAENYWGSCY